MTIEKIATVHADQLADRIVRVYMDSTVQPFVALPHYESMPAAKWPREWMRETIKEAIREAIVEVALGFAEGGIE